MIDFFYNLAICLVGLACRLAAPFNPKARLWVRGRRGLFRRLRETIDPQADIAWFHAASLGEFEQGRPVIEAFREKYPRYRILLTFFSPSGYQVRKNYTGADYVFYLPADTSWNARRLVKIVRPKIAVFIKYEFWRNYLRALRRNGARTFSVSAVFRSDSAFFNRWYGRSYRLLLNDFEHFFVQDEGSLQRLRAVGVTNVTVAGDTRFDRVRALVRQAKVLPLLESFASDGRAVFVAGSTWPPDEDLIVRLLNEFPETKFVIVPHEIRQERIEKLIASIRGEALCYMQLQPDQDISSAQVLIVDTIGILGSVYRYGRYGYIGGGFGVGIHNTLEAAAFGLPLAFGPNYTKFREAEELIALGGTCSVEGYEDLVRWYTALRDSPQAWRRASDACLDYVENGCGATRTILSLI